MAAPQLHLRFGVAQGKFQHGMLKGQTLVNNTLVRKRSNKKKRSQEKQ